MIEPSGATLSRSAMNHAPPAAVVLLGAQRFGPSLGAAVAQLGVTGKVALVTAGWQEREAEDEELAEHLGNRTVNLKLHARGEELFAEDPELRDAHRERQDGLRHRQDFYRIRLEHALEADQVIRQRAAPPEIVLSEAQASVDSIRELDRWHLAACARQHAEWGGRIQLHEREAVARHRGELAALIAGCQAIAIAGGHVATLINRLSLFGIAPMTAGKVIFAWSGGAMVVTERVVLFHDHPPQGPGASEVLDAGLGLVPGVVAMPQPEQRLRLEQTERLDRFVRRFAPARCLLLPARSRVTWRDGRFEGAEGVQELRPGGGHGPFVADERGWTEA